MQERRVRIIVGSVGMIAAIVAYVWFTTRYASGINTDIQPTLWLAFGAGLLSFISPCCLPLYPSYISYISGVTFSGNEKHVLAHRLKALTHTLFFVIGFSIVFLALGLSATVLGTGLYHPSSSDTNYRRRNCYSPGSVPKRITKPQMADDGEEVGVPPNESGLWRFRFSWY